MYRSLSKIIVSVVITAAGLVGVPASASAAVPAARHCVAEGFATEAAAKVASSGIRCFPKLSDAMSYASGGRIVVTDKASMAEVNAKIESANEVSSDPVSRATIILATFYTSTGYSGSSWTLTYGSACSAQTAVFYGNFVSPWNDNFESGKLFAGCYGRGFSGPNFSIYDTYLAFGYEAQYNAFNGWLNIMSSFKACKAAC